MKEAQITCTCKSIQVQDLGLTLRYGQQEWLDAAVAEGSKDLALAMRAGGVKVRYIERVQVRRSAPAPLLHHPPTPPIREEDWLAASSQASEKRLPGMVKVQVARFLEKAHEEVAEVVAESSIVPPAPGDGDAPNAPATGGDGAGRTKAKRKK